MRLIHTTTLKFHDFLGQDIPRYAILSHTWRDEEVSFADFSQGKTRDLKGYQKIKQLCAVASQQNLTYAWIDTACIDKSSSAELSEAINSMFRWYQNAQICLVYLDDIDSVADLKQSRWMTRGWTLQELIAPENVEFYNRSWVAIGSKQSMAGDLSRISQIDQVVLMERSALETCSIATRMSWAARRTTARAEDKAYCLMGMFNINMHIMYGEGGEKAFIRLQEAILETTDDQSILAWDRCCATPPGARSLRYRELQIGFLAPDPWYFHNQKIITLNRGLSSYKVTKRGLKISVDLLSELTEKGLRKMYAILDCRFEGCINGRVGAPLYSFYGGSDDKSHFISNTQPMVSISPERLEKANFDTICLKRRHFNIFDAGTYIPDPVRCICSVWADGLLAHGYQVLHVEPECGINSWNSRTLVSEIVTADLRQQIFRQFGFFHAAHNEAFIVSFLDDRRQASLRVETKPLTDDGVAWMRSKGMYDVTRPPSPAQDWIEGAQVQRLDYYRARTETGVQVLKQELMSDISFSSVTVGLKLDHKMDANIWILEVSLNE